MSRKRIDLVGKRFGRYTVVEECGRFPDGRIRWRCLCDCGNERFVSSGNLGRHANSCGCLARERSRQTHAKHMQSETNLYHVWQGMRQRCDNPNHRAYPHYGGRGISVCKEWSDYLVFSAWAVSQGYIEGAPKGTFTIDRIDVNGNYCPDNCRFIPIDKQAGNKRTNVLLEWNGETKTVAEWSKTVGLSHATILGRINRGWEAERILTTPNKRRNVE